MSFSAIFVTTGVGVNHIVLHSQESSDVTSLPAERLCCASDNVPRVIHTHKRVCNTLSRYVGSRRCKEQRSHAIEEDGIDPRPRVVHFEAK